jgi:gas vesicle protein
MANGKDFGAGAVIIAFLTGGIIGGVLALVFAPQSGEKTRKLIRDKTEDLVKKGEELYGEARAKGTEWMDKGKHYVEEKKEIVAAGVEAAKERAKKA